MWTVTQIVHFDGQDIYDTAVRRPPAARLPAFGVIVMVMVMAPTHGKPNENRQTNGKLMADTLWAKTFACLTWHTMATPIADPKRTQAPIPIPIPIPKPDSPTLLFFH